MTALSLEVKQDELFEALIAGWACSHEPITLTHDLAGHCKYIDR